MTLAPPLEQVLDGRQRGPDAGVVGDLAVLDRDVEVDPDQDALARGIDVADRLLVHSVLALRDVPGRA